MIPSTELARLETGIENLDVLLGGGLPKGSATVVAGPPGSGKTILTQQICFHNATAKNKVLYLGTVSEPTAKMLRFMQRLSFFDSQKLENAIHFVDLGVLLRAGGLEQISAVITQEIKRVKPSIVVVDSFKVFQEFAHSEEEVRRFDYEIAVTLMAWEATALLLGEYGPSDFGLNPLFSIADGLIVLSQRHASGEQQRFLQVVKMRGTEHSREEHPFSLGSSGIEVFAPRVVRRASVARGGTISRCKTFIPKLDDLLVEGVPAGSSILVGGVAGTGKTLLGLEIVYRGALAGERGILFSFEETAERLRDTARNLGMDLDREIERGMVEIVFIPQPEIRVDAHLRMIQQRVERMGATRIVLDSMSVFLHRIDDPQVLREKVFHLGTIVHNAGALGFFATDVPFGTLRTSRFGVEETVADGVILLTSTEEGVERQRYIEVYKLRNTAHLDGRHSLAIGPGGLTIFPRYAGHRDETPPPAVDVARRVPSGVPGLDELVGGGLLERSVTLLTGSPGIGKTIIGLQFVMDGAGRGERTLFVTFEEGPEQLVASAASLGLSLGEAIAHGFVEVIYASRDLVRGGHVLSLLTDRVEAIAARRVVIDSVAQLWPGTAQADRLRALLSALAARLKHLGVTTLLTLEVSSLFSLRTSTELAMSPVADNLIVLRYAKSAGRFTSTLRIIKTRGTAHDTGVRTTSIGPGGVRVGPARRTKPRS